MRENVIHCDKFNFISILEIKIRKAINEHATFYIRGHVPEGNNDYILKNSANSSVSFTAAHPTEGRKELFNGIISDIDMHIENDMHILSVNVVSRTTLMDIELNTRTFQDRNMTYQNVTERMSEKNSTNTTNTNFNFLWPTHGNNPIESMTVQYNETDWNYANRLAGRLGTVVVPDYLLDEPYISIGMTKRPIQQGIDTISYSIQKSTSKYRSYQSNNQPNNQSNNSQSTNGQPTTNYEENDTINYIVKSRDIYDLCDGIPFMGHTLFIYAIDSIYEGNELVHYYTLKEKSGFFTNRQFNQNILGVSLIGRVIDIRQDTVQVQIHGDVSQTEHK